MSRIEIRIAGFGGQGVVLAGVLLGQAAVLDGRHVVQTQSYGAESRGGAARSEVIISDEPIVYPKVLNPDILVAMSQVALDRYFKDLRPAGVLIVDQDLVTTVPEIGSRRCSAASFSETASNELGKALVANMVMLGFLAAVTDVVSPDHLSDSVRRGVPPATTELNLRALETGIRLAEGSRKAMSL